MPEQFSFRGLTDWFEIFRAGSHTDSSGNTRTWTRADLDQMVANHNAEHPAPFVAGHPKTDDPAYGWSAGLKRVGDVLLTKGRQIHGAFEKAVEDGRFRNRSIRVIKTDQGWKVGHVGFLGAAPPAVEGLAPIQYEADGDGATFEFNFREARKLNLLQRLVRRLREAWIDEHGIEKADSALPEHFLAELSEMETDERVDALTPDAGDLATQPAAPAFNRHQPPEADVPEEKSFTQADIDAAVAAERSKLTAEQEKSRRLEFENRCRYHQAIVSRLIDDDARLTPAQAEGLAEFMASLERVEESEFSFSVGEGDAAKTTKVKLADFFGDFLTKLPKQLALGRPLAGADVSPTKTQAASFSGDPVDPDRAALDLKARDYMAQHPGTDYVTAARLCEQQ